MNTKPSHFSAIGIPRCSIWGAVELEYYAWAYVTALARSGDEWKTITREDAWSVLTPKDREKCYPVISGGITNEKRWSIVAAQLKDAAGASAVGGFWRISK